MKICGKLDLLIFREFLQILENDDEKNKKNPNAKKGFI
jgi:hypothetical protein